MKISAVQAALLIGRNERRIRDWIATERLPAMKVGQTWQIDTEDLERIPGIKIDPEQLALLQRHEANLTQGLLGRIAELEHVIQGLHAEIASLNERLNRIEQRSEEGLRTVSQVHDFQRSSQGEYGVEGGRFAYPADLRIDRLFPGSIRMKQFALLHKVHAAILVYQIETGKIADTTVSTENGRKAHWLTPQQQSEVIAFWRRNGTHFAPCPLCPHTPAGTQNPALDGQA